MTLGREGGYTGQDRSGTATPRPWVGWRLDISWRQSICAVVVYSIGNVFGWMIPHLIAGEIERFGLSEGSAGLILTAETLLGGCASMLLANRLRWSQLRGPTAIAISLVLAANIAAFFAYVLPLYIVLRLICGLSGAILFIASSILAAATARPDRTFGQMVLGSNMFAAITMVSLPMLFPGRADFTYLPWAVLASLLLTPALLLMPARVEAASASGEPDAGASARPIGNGRLRLSLLVLALGLTALQSVSIFSFTVQLGRRIGMEADAVNLALGFATFLGSLGALAAAYLPARFHRALAIGIALSIALISNYVAVMAPSSRIFTIAICVNQIVAFFHYPLFLGWAAAIDPTGRASAVMVGAFVVISGIGPTVGGWIVQVGSLSALGIEALVANGAALASLAVLLSCVSGERIWTRGRANGA